MAKKDHLLAIMTNPRLKIDKKTTPQGQLLTKDTGEELKSDWYHPLHGTGMSAFADYYNQDDSTTTNQTEEEMAFVENNSVDQNVGGESILGGLSFQNEENTEEQDNGMGVFELPNVHESEQTEATEPMQIDRRRHVNAEEPDEEVHSSTSRRREADASESSHASQDNSRQESTHVE